MSSPMSRMIYTLVLLSVAFWNDPVSAHTHLLGSLPEKGQTLRKELKSIILKLSEKAEPRFSKIEVISESTQKHVESGQPVLTEDGHNYLEVRLLQPLAPGNYHVKWNVTSVDTHKSHGEFDFSYAP